MKADKDSAKWNPKYMINNAGRAYRISQLSLKQTNRFIGIEHSKLKTSKVHLEQLYQRRAILMGEPQEEGKTRRKMLEALQFKEKKMNWSIRNADEGARIKAIVLMALNHLENGADVSLIEAILKQARDESD